jgi:hypothetical protein
MNDLRDVFLCHASEDKETVVRPLAEAFWAAGISCWVDEGDIGWGESFTKRIGEGLTKSRYVIPVISQVFVGKSWPEYELDAALGIEAAGQEAKVLPLIVDGQIDLLNQVKERYPFLQNRKFLFWSGDPQPVIKALKIRLGETMHAVDTDAVRSEKPIEQGTTYIPKLKKEFTQRDKDHFLEVAFNAIRDYFRRAVEELQAQYNEVDANFIEVDNERFRCRLYQRGALLNECLIRTSAFISRDSIGYTEGTRILSENSYNEIVTVVDDEPELCLRFSMGVFPYGDRSKHFDPVQAGEALWRRFVSPLERR